MAIGTMALVSKDASQGPIYFDHVTVVGATSYTSGGDTGIKAGLQALTKDGRVPFACIAEDGLGFVVNYDGVAEKLLVYQQSAATSALTQVSGSQAAFTYKLCLLSR